MNTGASGALDAYSTDAQKHAEVYYESVRNRTGDAEKIAANTGFSVEDIKEIREHVFFNAHDF